MPSLRVAPALVALALLAGCFGGPTPSPTPSPSASDSSTPPAPPGMLVSPPVASPEVELLVGFAFEQCRGVSVQQIQPAADVQALLPPGFTVAPSMLGDGTAVVGLDLYACGNLTVAGTSRLANTYYGQLYTYIAKPSARLPGAPSADLQEYLLRVLAGPDVLSVLWAKAGYDTRSGDATVNVGPVIGGSPVDPGIRSGDGTVGADYYVMVQGSRPVTPIPGGGSFARYTALADGSVLVWTGTYDFPAPYGGQGVFQVAGDDPFAPFAHARYLSGLARTYESGGIAGQDLRRVFTPPT